MSNELRAAIIQDAETRAVLMLGWMNSEAERLTNETGRVHFWSRSRGRLWMKGESSGNTLEVVAIAEDCDRDALLIQVRPSGPTCHKGTKTCWGDAEDLGLARLERLWKTIESRSQQRPAGSYTVTLLDDGPDLPARKVAEEAVEVLMAAKDHAFESLGGNADDQRLADEAADLIYHLFVLLKERDVDPRRVLDQLDSRSKE